MGQPSGLYALEQLPRLPQECTHELPLGDGFLCVLAMSIIAVSVT